MNWTTFLVYLAVLTVIQVTRFVYRDLRYGRCSECGQVRSRHSYNADVELLARDLVKGNFNNSRWQTIDLNRETD